MIYRLINKSPGSQGTKVFVGFVGIMSFCSFTFFGGKKKKSGEGAFDTERPESVQRMIDEKASKV